MSTKTLLKQFRVQPALLEKCCLFVRVSGQLKVARQYGSFSRPFHGLLRLKGIGSPTIKSLGYLQLSAKRGLFGQSKLNCDGPRNSGNRSPHFK